MWKVFWEALGALTTRTLDRLGDYGEKDKLITGSCHDVSASALQLWRSLCLPLSLMGRSLPSVKKKGNTRPKACRGLGSETLALTVGVKPGAFTTPGPSLKTLKDPGSRDLCVGSSQD